MVITQRFGTAFPAGTVVVNLTGCFIMAALMTVSGPLGWSQTARMAATVGFLGGFTTYSSFNQETMMLWERGATSAAMLNLAVTLVGGLAAGWVGVMVGRRVIRSDLTTP